MRRLALLLTVTSMAVLGFASASGAATIQDLRTLGYTVTVQFQTPACTNWVISGFGMTDNSLGCEGTADFQATIDQLADPAGHCNRVWQSAHPDQVSALATIRGKGHAISGDQCADVYTVVNQYTSAVVYSGPAAGLVDLAATLRPAEPAPVGGGDQPAAAAAAPVAATCLPLCPTVPVSEPPATADPASGPSAAAAAEPPTTAATSDTEPLVVTGSFVSTLTVSSSLVEDARAVPVANVRNPVLASALTLALGRTVRILPTTVCAVGTSIVRCSRLVKYMDGRKVRVRLTAAGAQRVTIMSWLS